MNGALTRRLRLPFLGGALAVLLACVPAALGDPASELESIDARIARLEAQVEEAKQREHVLTLDIDAASERIDTVVGQIDVYGETLQSLEAELAEQRRLLAELADQLEVETRRLRIVERADRVAQRRLEERLVELYTTDPPDAIEIVFQVRSLNDLISQLEYVDQVAELDREIATEVEEARANLAATRRRTAAAKAAQAETTALIAARTDEQRDALARLVGYRDELVAAQEDRRDLLAAVHDDQSEAQEDLDALQAASAELEQRLRVSSASVDVGSLPAPSASGFIWPVNGAVVSGFGPRWGRMHEGVDIAAGFGTPILAAAAGTVSYAGWLGGYGNLVVVEHGGGIATAYAHQQQIYVSLGTSVSQGQQLGEVGSTGNSSGPHLHFEVRVNGSAVDPLGYL
jgi:murein DD-endopeptidase MepM/ murein hydrolase activator NlpD